MYYKLPASQLPEVLPAVRALQSQLAAGGGVCPRLQARVDAPAGKATVMEVYADIADPPAFAARLEAAVAASALPAQLRAGRRRERFRDL